MNKTTNEKISTKWYKKKWIDNISYFKIALYTFIAVISLATTLLINYLVYFPKVNDFDFSLKDRDSLYALIISVLMIFLILFFYVYALRSISKQKIVDNNVSASKTLGIGFAASLLDTIGVGCFATSMGMLKLSKIVKDDKMLPGILNIGFTVPVLIEAVIFVSAIKVDIIVLISLVVSSVVGSLVGSLFSHKINASFVKWIIGISLFIISIAMILIHPQVHLLTIPKNHSLATWKLILSCFIFLLLGVLTSFGVGMYAPSMAVIMLMGMDIEIAFPIMMCSSALILPINSIKAIKNKNFMQKTSIYLTAGGIFGTQISFLLIFVLFKLVFHIDKNDFSNFLEWLSVIVTMSVSVLLITENILNARKNKNQNQP